MKRIMLALFLLNAVHDVQLQEPVGSSYNVVSYGERINQAELLITEGHYSEAFVIYDSLKNTSGLWFIKDGFNASLCLAYGKVNSSLPGYLRYLVQNGVRTSWLQRHNIFMNAVPQSLWDELRGLETKYYNTPNPLRETLNSLTRKDQEYRKHYNAYATYNDEIRAADSSNISILNRIIKEYKGFPNEKHIGVSDSGLVWQPYYIIIWHQTVANKLYEYSSIILDEITKGNVEPHIGSSLYTTCSGDGKKFGTFELTKIVYTGDFSDSIIQTNRKLTDSLSKRVDWRIPIYPDQVIERINKDRRKYGMESIADLYKKTIFMNSSKKGFIFFQLKRNVFLTSQKQFAESFNRIYKPILSNTFW